MFGLAIRYLNGWAMAAADGARKERAEWPPHPDRVFMALAAAWFETGQEPAEGEALRWLEGLADPPAIEASEAERRRTTGEDRTPVHFVPVNDPSIAKAKRVDQLLEQRDTSLADLKAAGLGQLAEYRNRQPRSFPVAIPHRDLVHLIWRLPIPEAHRDGLATLCRKVVSIGHSASLVEMWLEENPPAPTLVPVRGVAPHRLRIFGPGRLEYLEQRLNRARVLEYLDRQGAIEVIREEIDVLRKRFGKSFEAECRKRFGHSFDSLAYEEARYFARSPDADAIRDRIAASEQQRDRPSDAGGAGGLSLKELEAEQAARFPQGAPVSQRPLPGLWQGYAPPIPAADVDSLGGPFDPRLVVLALSGRTIALPGTLKLTEALRGALLAHFGERPIPEWISGHTPERTPSKLPHLAFLPLPFVGREHADGRVMGVALAIPRAVDPEAVEAALSPWLRDESGQPCAIRLFDGQWLECVAELETRQRPPWNLLAETWTGASRRWGSVTPLVLERHFDGADKWERAVEAVKEGCERAGLPRPLEVLLHPVSLFEGVPRSNQFPWISRKRDGGRMHHAHAVILFAERVQGPLLLGAGRFRGYGLFRPLMRGAMDDV